MILQAADRRGRRVTHMIKRDFCRVTLLTGATTLVGLASCAPAPQPEAAPPVMPVYVSTAVEREIELTRDFVGSVMPVRSSVVGSGIDGRVDQFLVNEGDRVTKGAELARLLDETVQIELSRAERELELRQNELLELENGTREEEIIRAKAQMDSAEATLKYARQKRQRTEELFDRGRTVSLDELEQARSQFEEAHQAYLAARAEYELAVAGPRQEKIDQARSRVEVQKKQVDTIRDQLRKHTIRAPFDGYIVAEHTEEGEWVREGDPVVEIVQLDEVEIRVYVPEQYLAPLRVGATARITFDALPGHELNGTVVLIVPRADVRSRSFPVKVRLDNPVLEDSDAPRHLVNAGMLATVALNVGGKKSALFVSKDALVLGGATPLVYTFHAEQDEENQGRVRPVPVTTHADEADELLVRVEGPLQAGQPIVVRGNERLRANQPVRVVKVVPPDAVLSAAAEPSPEGASGRPGSGTFN